MDLNALSDILGKNKNTKTLIIIAIAVFGFYMMRKMNPSILTAAPEYEPANQESKHRKSSSRSSYE